ncbi:xanthine dehydrogenase family protein molybdopterin-binding subunit [Fodinicurvata sp. EGI_FJ10296]|uniref:xanthine dehydrogenase family protein molybdopterin-binding subunit n=1 Tax=Fodinicurvata sp. EGI_FJ10296 TaxID=3231908 RepID=UPI00345154F5
MTDAASDHLPHTDSPHTVSGPIGHNEPRARARRTVAGKGRYVDDIVLPRMLHVAFLRSPHAHAAILSIDAAEAREAPGIVAVVTGKDMATQCTPYAGSHQLFKRLKAPDQYPLAVDRVLWQGEPVVAVVATSRALAEDAAELVDVDYDILPAVTSFERGTPPAVQLHDDIPDNIALVEQLGTATVGEDFPGADQVFEAQFRFGRITGTTLEPRGIIADYEPREGALTVHCSHQCPHQQQDIFARHLGLPEHKVRVLCPDVGGAFGLKQQLYGDEFAVCALSIMLGRPVKFIADRLESMVSDNHARDHAATARIAVKSDGTIVGMEVDDIFGIGPYSQYPRSSVGEGNHVLRITGAPYRLDDYRARLTMVYQNKSMIGHYRSVGHPVACAITEGLVDLAADGLGLDPADIRRRNFVRSSDCPRVSPGGIDMPDMSLETCFDAVVAAMDLPALRAEQAEMRKKGVYRGIGIAAFVELTASGPEYYGPGGNRITSQEGCHLKLEPSGVVRCWISVTDQGQGTDTGIGQVVASHLGVAMADVRVFSGDSETTPYGGGAWASRGIAIGGEAALRAATALKANILELAAVVLQADAGTLDIVGGRVVDRDTGTERMPLSDVARIGYFRQDTLPPGVQPELSVVRHYVTPRGRKFMATNGVHAAHVEVDTQTGIVRCLGHWVAHDAGVVVNPSLVEEQIRGGVVQGIGSALFEELRYDDDGQMLSGSLADYLVPMASEMPEITVLHVEGTGVEEELGAKGVGEAGVAGSPAAIMNAVNDAIAGAGLGQRIHTLPLSPERILGALGKVPGEL